MTLAVMRARVENHRFLRSLVAGVLLVVATVAPFSESWHEASVQHVRCAEHGELTHVAVSTARIAVPLRAGAPHLALNGGNPGIPETHEHCEFAFIVEGSAQTPAVHTTVRMLPPSVVTARPALLLPAPGRAFLLASAPKTSPPRA
ncbi:MAG TPA: hypothetical protein VH328_06710 [Burkholderiaceae bacterium]|nr:hypothetical protein [Burkholderiaceae bacterium]